MKKKISPISRIYMALIFVFLYAPIAVMMVFSFNSGSSTYIMEGFSTHWWSEMFHNSAAMKALENTVVLALATAAVSVFSAFLPPSDCFSQRINSISAL